MYKLKDSTVKAVFFSKDTVKETLEFLVDNNIGFSTAGSGLVINKQGYHYNNYIVICPVSKTVISYTQQEMANLAEPIKQDNSCFCGVFTTPEYSIPLVNVSHLEKTKNSSGAHIVMNGSTWDAENDCYHNAPYLKKEDREQFEKLWLDYISAQSSLLLSKE